MNAVGVTITPSDVRVHNIDIAFGGHRVIEGLDLAVGQSEFLVLLGPSGCGKSTLLNAIAGLLDVNAGQIFIGGRNVTWEEPASRGIAMVFQSYALYPRMTVRGNLSFGLKIARLPRAEIDKRVTAAAEMLRLGPLLDRRPAQLSGGQRQRVAIGRALVREAPVFLFDEPLSNLDAQLRAELRVEIKRLHRRIGATMIYVTHDQIEALTLADRIAVMQGGKIQQLDTPQTIYARPANRFVAAFVGSPAMNFLSGRMGGGRFAGDDFTLPLPGAAEDGRPAVLGIRPEHVVLGQGGSAALTAAVEMVEPMGADSLVWCRLGGASLSARVSGQARIAPGESLPINLPAEHISLFDETSGDRLPFHIS